MEQRVNMETCNGLQYCVSYRSIKYPRLEFKSGSLVAILPRSGIAANEFIKKHEKWINDRTLIINQALENAKEKRLQRRSKDYRFRDVISSLSLGFCKEFGFNVNKFILTDKGHVAVPQSLIEKVERIVKHWKDRAKDFEKIYNEGTAVISEINELKRRQEELGFNDLEYSILVLLEDQFGKSDNLSTDVKSFYDSTLQSKLFKGWYSQYTARRDIETEIRRFLRKYMRERKLSYDELQKLYEKILDDVIAYGTKS